MKTNQQLFILLIIVAVIMGVSIGWLVSNRTDDSDQSVAGPQTVRARVVSVLKEGQAQMGDRKQIYQDLLVEVLDGPLARSRFTVDYGRRALVSNDQQLEVGQTILITVDKKPDGSTYAIFTDTMRLQPLLILTLLFVAFILVVGRSKGLRSLLSMGVSFVVILYGILPAILDGRDPLWASVIGAFLFLAVTQYLIYGWTLKAHTAMLGMFIALIFTAFLATTFVDLTGLTGFGSEDALILAQIGGSDLNMRGLLLGGILIGALGVLDDLVIGQVSVVFGMQQIDPLMPARQLFRRAMVVGQDHIAATVNTLVLAYVGASLPLLLIFVSFNQPFLLAINRQFIAEEIVRALVGSLGLVLSVPICTYLAALVSCNSERILARSPWLSAESGGEHTTH